MPCGYGRHSCPALVSGRPPLAGALASLRGVVYGLTTGYATRLLPGFFRSEYLPVYIQYGSIHAFFDGFFDLVEALGDLLG